jgi:hypothetical protein
MRVFLGMILGSALTILLAFAVDTAATSPTTANTGTVTETRPMVNWDVVGIRWRGLQAELQDLGANVRRGWNRLVG